MKKEAVPKFRMLKCSHRPLRLLSLRHRLDPIPFEFVSQIVPMNFKRNVFFLASVQLLLSAVGLSQNSSDTTLTLDMQMRVRSEWREGYKVATDSETLGDLVTVQRSRMALKGKWKSFDYKLGAQDVRTFGGPSGETQGTIGISEAWWSTEMTYGMRLKVGRQEIKFDNERIVGAVDWSNPGRFLDGVRWDRKKEDPSKGNTTVAVTWDELRETRRYMVYHRAMVGKKNNKLTFLFFDQDSRTEPSPHFTTGFTTRFHIGPRAWFATEAYVQYWPAPISAFLSLPDRGSMIIGDLGWNGDDGHKWQVGIDLLDDEFFPFLGTNHRHYGWMDQFYVGTQTPGLTNLRLRHTGPINLRPLPSAKGWGAAFHHFQTAGFGDLLGNELDLWITGNKGGALSWHVGFSVFDATERHIERQGEVPAGLWSDAAGRIQHWGWVSLNFTPSLVLK